MSSIKIWARVPDGSKLEVSVTKDSGTIVGAARFRRDDGTEEEWVHSQLSPGPKTKLLRSPHDYAVTLRVEFTGAGTSGATIDARIVKPGGDVHGSPYSYSVTGAKGDDARATVFIQMVNG
jgi:hypothetical protein